MPNIPLIATEIYFTPQSIVYKVKTLNNEKVNGVVFCHKNIKDKDLVLKPTLVDKDNMEVVFTPVNVSPHFYQQIHKKILRHLSEFENEMDRVYKVGETVGFVIA
jgi:capsid portal protein